MLFGKKKLIGLDVGTSTIKLAELDVSRGGAKLLSFGLIQTPPSATSGGEIVETAPIAESVRQLIHQSKTRRKHAATGLWGSSVIVKKISIPRMDEDLIAEQIRWEAEQYVPYDINEVSLEYKVLKGIGSQSSETMDILLVAAVHDAIFKCAEIVETAGLSCSVVDVVGFALANCFERNYGHLQGQTISLFNIGASVTNFVVVENGEVVFCRDIPVGGNTYTLEIQKGMNISPEEAEAMKIGASQGQPVPEEVGAIIQSTHEIVSDEINGSIEFFLNTTESGKINRAFVTGGGARLTGLLEYLAKFVPCEPLDPFLRVKPKSLSQSYIGQVRDFAAVAVGLGMREVD